MTLCFFYASNMFEEQKYRQAYRNTVWEHAARAERYTPSASGAYRRHYIYRILNNDNTWYIIRLKRRNIWTTKILYVW